MSLSWPRELHLALLPDGAALMVWASFPRRVVHQAAWVSEAADPARASWKPAMDTLRKHLVPRYYNAGKVRVTLSNHFCRYALFPRPAALSGEPETLAYAAHRMRGAFGDEIQQWDLRVSKYRDDLLVCGVERALLDALAEVFRENHLPLVSTQPYFATAFNRFRTRVGQADGWFVVQEAGRVVVSRFEDGQWRGLVSRRTADDTPAAVLAVLARERRLQQCEENEARNLWLTSAATILAPADFAGSPYDVTVLNLPLPKRAQAEDQLPYAMAA